MASIEEGTRGKHLSYKIRVCLERDENGRQISKAMRWNPPEDMTPAKAKKEAQRVAAVWEAEQAVRSFLIFGQDFLQLLETEQRYRANGGKSSLLYTLKK